MAALPRPLTQPWLVLIALVLGMAAALTAGCDDKVSREVVQLRLAGRTFYLELSNTDQTRFRGLSERTHIEPDGGMLFVFPDNQVQVHGFVMRDCPVQIDIIYVDAMGKVVAMYEMMPEPPRTEAEKAMVPPFANAPAWTYTNPAYENRLRKYSSQQPSQFVIELRGGTLKQLQAAGLKVGDVLALDLAGLKRGAR